MNEEASNQKRSAAEDTGTPENRVVRWGRSVFKAVDVSVQAIATLVGIAFLIGVVWLAGAAIFSGTQRGLLGGLAIGLTLFLMLASGAPWGKRIPRDWRITILLSCVACWVGLLLI